MDHTVKEPMPDQMVGLRLPAEIVRRVDAIRRADPVYIPTRSQVIRELITEALERREKG